MLSSDWSVAAFCWHETLDSWLKAEERENVNAAQEKREKLKDTKTN